MSTSTKRRRCGFAPLDALDHAPERRIHPFPEGGVAGVDSPDLDVGEGAEQCSMASGQRDFGLVLDPQVHIDYWADDLYQLVPGLEPGGGTEDPTRERRDLPGRADQSATRLQVHDLRRGLVDERVDLPVGTI